MMHKQTQKGFTLLEVMLSVALFMIISVGFFTVFSMVYMNTYRSTVFTEDAFYAQQQIETSIASVKNALENNSAPLGYTTSVITMFSGSNARAVTAYHITQTNASGKTLETYLSQLRAPLLQTPKIINGVSIDAFSAGVKVTHPSIGMPNLSIDLGSELILDNPGLLVRYLYYWYISKPGNAIVNSPPIFPDDYQIILDKTSRLISAVPNDYGGRFLKLVVTPVGEKGQMGTSFESEALYISALPLSDHLIFHFDASAINKDDATQVRSTTINGEVANYIKQGIDLGPLGLNLNQTIEGKQVLLNVYSLDSTHEIQGAVGVSGVNTGSLSTSTSPSVGSKLNMTIYFAAKFDDAFPNNTTIFQSKASAGGGNRWILSTGSSGNLVLTRYLASTSASDTKTLISDDVNYRASLWKIFKLEVFSNRLAIEVDGINIGSTSYTSTSQTMMLTDFKISFDSRMTLGEVLIFDVAHASGSTQSEAIVQYFNDKIKP